MSALPQEILPYAAAPEIEGGRSFGEVLHALARRRAWLIGVSLLLLGLAAAVALLLPPVFRSTATILIKEQEIPQDMVRSTVTSYADERIQVIAQQVMTRATLLDMVERVGLYARERRSETSEEILDRMRRDIRITPISAEVTNRNTGSSGKATIAFSLSYDSDAPANAQKIANELTTLFLNENVKYRQQKAAETTSFLDVELGRMTKRIQDLEQQITEFKGRHRDRLPELGQVNLAAAERTHADLQRVERDIAYAIERRDALQSQLAETKPTAVPGGVALETEQQLVVAQKRLATLRSLYTDEHPEVKAAQREIANLRDQVDAYGTRAEREVTIEALAGQLAALRQQFPAGHPDARRLAAELGRLRAAAAADAASAASSKASDAGSDAPEWQRNLNPVWLNLKRQLEATNAQVRSMQTERQALRARLADYDARLGDAPGVEREYLDLVRDLDSTRGRLRELQEKQILAQVAEQLERERKAERFTLIEPPVFPEKPVRPNRPLILMLGAALALVGGIGAAALREAIDATVHTPRELVRLFPVPLLAVVPSLPSPYAQQRRMRRRWIAAAMALAALLLALTAMHFLYMPLDVAWYGILRRISN